MDGETNAKGLGCLFAIGQWAGLDISFHVGGFRVEFGWLTITLVPFDGDVLFQLAIKALEQQEHTENLRSFNEAVDKMLNKD